jgi:hypothetical protein
LSADLPTQPGSNVTLARGGVCCTVRYRSISSRVGGRFGLGFPSGSRIPSASRTDAPRLSFSTSTGKQGRFSCAALKHGFLRSFSMRSTTRSMDSVIGSADAAGAGDADGDGDGDGDGACRRATRRSVTGATPAGR